MIVYALVIQLAQLVREGVVRMILDHAAQWSTLTTVFGFLLLTAGNAQYLFIEWKTVQFKNTLP